MKKIIIILLAFYGCGSAALAQNTAQSSANNHEVSTNKFWDNWFVSVGGGAEMLYGNNDDAGKFKNRISPTLNVAVGKWFTPGLGLRLQYSGLQGRGYARDANNGYVDAKGSVEGFYKQRFEYMNLHGDVLFNLSSLFFGYNAKRVYELIPYLGAGFTHSYSKPQREGLTVNGGLINRFRISPVLDANLELSLMCAENKFDGEVAGKKDYDAVAAATVGVTYYFKSRGFSKSKPCAPQLIGEAELSSMRNKMNALLGEVQELKDSLSAAPKEVVVVQEKVVSDEIPSIAPHAIFFNLGSAVVSPQELINLGFMADQVKEYPTLKLKLTGYADAATGTAEANRKVSLKRAEAVADALYKTYGIARSRMTTDAAGGVDKFEKEYLNRMVMIEVVQ